jgi:hypothetical protein
MQDRFNASVEKLKEIFVTIAEPLMPILDIFAGILSIVGLITKPIGYLFEKMSLLGPVLGGIVKFLSAAAIAAFLLTTSLSGGLAAAGILAAIGGGMVLYQSYMQPVQDGIAPANKGPFTITDSYGATAITSVGDGLAVSPNIRTQSAPQTQTTSPTAIIDYEKLGTHLAQAVSRVTVQSNLDGVSVSSRLQTPMGIATRKI